MIPILFQTKFISLQTLWFFVVIALLISSYLAVKRLKRKRVNFNLFIEHSTSFLFVSLLCSRVFYFFSHPNAYFPALDLRTLLNFFSIWDQGLSLWGALIGFMSILSYRIYKANENLWKWLDAIFIPALVAYMIGMLGAFLGGVAYGRPTDLPWGVRYEIANVKYTVPVHPTQIYSILAIALLLWSKKLIKEKTDFFEQDGNASIYLTTGFAGLSFILEFFRGDDTLLIQGIRLPFFISGLVLLLSGIALIKRFHLYKTPRT